MKEDKAIPKGYMTVGEVAKLAGVTVRALQYYDKEGLFSPSAFSDGGRRLYNDKDLFNLHCILSLKSLGFSFEEIKNELNSLDTPERVAEALERQCVAVKEQIEKLQLTYINIEKLKKEVMSMKEVDFKRYADIIVNLQMNNEGYSVIKYMDEKTMEKMRKRFDKEGAKEFIKKMNDLLERAQTYKSQGIPAEDEKATALAAEFWQMINEFTEGDMSVVNELMNLRGAAVEGEWKDKQQIINEFISPAMKKYFEGINVDVFKEQK